MQVLADQQELTYNSSPMWTHNVVWRIYWEQWIIRTNGERERDQSNMMMKSSLYVFTQSLTKSIFKQSLEDFNSEISFEISCHTKDKNPTLPNYLSIAKEGE